MRKEGILDTRKHFSWIKKAGVFFTVAGLVTVFFILTGKGQDRRDVDQCLQCHGAERGITAQNQHPLIKEGKCRDCHSSYDEESHQEFEKPGLRICVDCHGDQTLGRSHPVGNGMVDPNTNGEMTCVSTCHVPHGTDYKFQVPFENNMQLCLSCHKEF